MFEGMDEIRVFDLETTMDHKTIHMASWTSIRRNLSGSWSYGGTSESVEWAAPSEHDFSYEWLRNPTPTEIDLKEETVPVAKAGHNIINFDCPVLASVFPELAIPLEYQVDTLLLAQMVYPDNPGGHSLKALAHLVGEAKMDAPNFEVFTPAMVTYGKHDTHITAKLLVKLLNDMDALKFSQKSYDLEREVKVRVGQLEKNGFKLDMPKATLFRADLNDRLAAIEEQMQGVFYPEIKAIKGRVSTNLHEVKGVAEVAEIAAKFSLEVPLAGKLSLWRVTPCLLSSRQQIAARLLHAGWKPSKYTPLSLEKYKVSGNKEDLTPILDETTLEESPVPQAALLAERFRLLKTLAFVEKWLELVKEDGRVYGRVISIGAPTARMAHSNPNMAQVPKVGNPNGYECRDCWTVEEGWVLVGADASGLELRCLAHYAQDAEMSYEILEGDIHTKNQEAVGLPSRDDAKTFIYAWLYGAGPDKLGKIGGRDHKWGQGAKQRLLKRWKGISRLIDKIDGYADEGYLPGLDGRVLLVRKKHAALNTLLQGAGAIIMKMALVICCDELEKQGIEYKMVANVHDEFQIEVRKGTEEQVMRIAVESIVQAGVVLGLRVPLAGEAKTGQSWAGTH
jgi:DNA polymerase I-like protein with 3'-5' exonuclease and polymerase domains